MARRPRIDFPGAWHHVMHRGARRAPIFKRDDHCELFLETLGDTVRRSGLEIHAYSLMPNHFHLLVRSPRATLSRGMKHLIGNYVQRINTLRGWDGPMFRGRFKNQLVTRDEYLRHLMAYIALNPVRAHLVARPDEPCWTSFRAHVGLESAPPWLSDGAVRDWFGGPKGLAAWVQAVQIKREQPPTEMSSETGWFRADRDEPAPPAPEAPKPPPLDAADLLERLSDTTGASIDSLRKPRIGRGGNPARRFAALTLVNGEALSQSEVARIMGMTVKGVSGLVHRAARRGGEPAFAAWRDKWEAVRRAERKSPRKSAAR